MSSITVTWGTWRGGSFTGDFKGQQKRTGNGVSLCKWAVRGPGGRVALLGTLKDM